MTFLKQTPAYDLNHIKEAFDCPENLVMTSSAKRGQIELDFSDEDVVTAIQALVTKDFYKSILQFMKILQRIKMYIELISSRLLCTLNFKLTQIEN